MKVCIEKTCLIETENLQSLFTDQEDFPAKHCFLLFNSLNCFFKTINNLTSYQRRAALLKPNSKPSRWIISLFIFFLAFLLSAAERNSSCFFILQIISGPLAKWRQVLYMCDTWQCLRGRYHKQSLHTKKPLGCAFSSPRKRSSKTSCLLYLERKVKEAEKNH